MSDGYQKQSWHFAACLLLSIAMHSLLLLQLNQMHVADAVIPHQPTVVEVSLLYPPMVKKVPQVVKPEPPKPNIVKKRMPSIHKKKHRVSTPKKVVKQAIKTREKLPEVSHEVLPSMVKKAPREVQSISNSVATKIIKKTLPPSNNQAQLKQIKQHYLAHILSIIQSHKHYPYSARRRHIEGDIQVSFMVDQQGHISALAITGSSSVLRSSTKRAIDDSLPFPLPSKLLLQPMHSQFIMQYRLK